MRLFSKLPQKLDRGLNWRRLRVLFRKPFLLVRNARFLFPATTSEDAHIFVVGPPRSGTTLVKNILRSHSQIASIDDESFFFFRRNYYDLELPDLRGERIQSLVHKARDAVQLFDLIAREVREKKDAERFLEKTASHALRLSFILERFPESQVVFAVRDVRDGFLSAQRNPAYWASLDSSDPLRSYAETWRESVQQYLKYQEHEQVRLVRYETLCEDPAPQIRLIMRFLDQPFQKRQLRPKEYSQTKVSEQQGHERLGEPISGKTIGQWKTEMKAEMQNRLHEIAGEQLQAIGYPDSTAR